MNKEIKLKMTKERLNKIINKNRRGSNGIIAKLTRQINNLER